MPYFNATGTLIEVLRTDVDVRIYIFRALMSAAQKTICLKQILIDSNAQNEFLLKKRGYLKAFAFEKKFFI